MTMKMSSYIIGRPARTTSDGSFEFSDTTPKYGLPANVKYCSTCGSQISANSTVETMHTSVSTKKTISFDENNICDACNTALMKDGIVGVTESYNSESYAIDTEVEMAAMIA